MATVRNAKAIVAKNLAQRESLWPGAEPWLWHRKANKGFATISKTMPLILQIMDDLSNGKPWSSTYLGLWCETWDNSMVNVSKQQEMAHAAGFAGQRATYTWGGRMQLLHKLQFIDIKPVDQDRSATCLSGTPTASYACTTRARRPDSLKAISTLFSNALLRSERTI